MAEKQETGAIGQIWRILARLFVGVVRESRDTCWLGPTTRLDKIGGF